MKPKGYEIVWVKCPACAGMGTKVIDNNTVVAVLTCAHLKASDRALIAQGVCVVCRGKGEIKVDHPGFFRRVWYKLFA